MVSKCTYLGHNNWFYLGVHRRIYIRGDSELEENIERSVFHIKTVQQALQRVLGRSVWRVTREACNAQ
jgi:hypothetical protein